MCFMWICLTQHFSYRNYFPAYVNIFCAIESIKKSISLRNCLQQWRIFEYYPIGHKEIVNGAQYLISQSINFTSITN